MSKKQNRVSQLISIFSALSEAKEGTKGFYEYEEEKIEEIQRKIKNLLAEEGVFPASD